MKLHVLVAVLAVGLSLSHAARAGEADYAALVAEHARANGVPELLVHRVIMRESRYRPELVGRGGTIGLMQIKLETARSLGYHGDAAGLADPATNLTYGVRYLAGAYHAADGDHARAMRFFAGGYYYVAKRQKQELARQGDLRQARLEQIRLEPSGNPQPQAGAGLRKKLARGVRNARAQVPHR